MAVFGFGWLFLFIFNRAYGSVIRRLILFITNKNAILPSGMAARLPVQTQLVQTLGTEEA